MGDDSSAPSKSGIPAWQRTQPESAQSSNSRLGETSTQEDKSSSSAKASIDAAPKEDERALVQKAKQFLENDSVKHEPADKKTAFLTSQGLSKSVIDTAMHTAEPSSTTPTTTPERFQASIREQPSRDVPPIITYPEFLIHANKPPPIVTANRLLNLAYVATGAAAAVYGVSKYLVGPMTDSLQASRHDFALNAQARVEDLYARLGNAISINPEQVIGDKVHEAATLKNADSVSNVDSDDSNPTELFHRDFGTQTSAVQSPKHRSSASSSSGELIVNRENSSDFQASTMRRLSDLCKELSTENNSEGDTSQEISTVLRVVQEHLESLSLPSNAFTANSMYDAYSVPRDGKKEEDEVTKIKAEIRSVKGLLLSSRNFPGVSKPNFPPIASG